MYKIQLNYLHVVAVLITGTILLYSCNFSKKASNQNSATFYYYGNKKIEITIPSGDTLGLLLRDDGPGDSSQTNFTAVKKQIESILVQEGYVSVGFIPKDGNILRITPTSGNKSIPFLEKEAGRLKENYKTLILNAGYLSQVKESKATVFVTNEIIVEFKAGVSDTVVKKFFSDYGLILKRKSPFVPNEYTVTVSDKAPADALKMTHQLRDNTLIKSADINLIYIKEFEGLEPTDELFIKQWHLLNRGSANITKDADIDAELAWDFTMGSEDIIIAVIDNGFDADHEDLRDNYAYNNDEIPLNNIDDDRNGFVDDILGRNFVNNSNNLNGGNHGTEVAGVAAADSNGLGVVGSCPECSLLPIVTRLGSTTQDDVDAIDYAISRGAKIINCSWNPTAAIPRLPDVINRAEAAGVLLICSMKNTPVPSCATGSLSELGFTFALSRSNCQDLFDNSGTGECLDLLAPSAYDNNITPRITTTDIMGPGGDSNGIFESESCPDDVPDALGNYMSCFKGTSASAPLTAGVAGLLLSANPSLTPQQLRYLLQDCADKIEPSRAGYAIENGKSITGTHGFGRLNAYEAVKIVSSRTDKGGRNGVDIFIRDNELDWGNTEQPSNWRFEENNRFIGHWKSPDIKIDAPDINRPGNPYEAAPVDNAGFENLGYDKPVSNRINKVYVRVRNRGYRTAASVNIKLYWVYGGLALPALWSGFPADRPGDPVWNYLGTQTISNLQYSGSSLANNPGADAAQIVSFDFTSPDPALNPVNHYCLLAMIDSPDDPLPSTEVSAITELDDITPYYNNITHKNFSIEPGGGLAMQALYIHNPTNKIIKTKVTVDNPKKISFKLSNIYQDSLIQLRPKEKRLIKISFDHSNIKHPVEITLKQEIWIDDKKKITGGFSFYFANKK